MRNTFTGEVKEQLCRIPPEKSCDALAEIYGLLLFATTFSEREIRHMTEHRALAKRIQQLFARAFQMDVELKKAGKGGKYILLLEDPAQIQKILAAFGLDASRRTILQINRAMLEEECCRNAFLRGVFLASGTIASPEKRYHLELVTPHLTLSRECTALLLDMNMEPKLTQRGAYYVLYFKNSERIEDFLTRIGAPSGAMEVMNAKVEKDVRNQINRQVNCEAANISKTVNAAAAQLEAIRILEERHELETLPETLRQVAEARRANPELSLTALAELLDPPANRATVNYRLKKLVERSRQPQE